MTVSRRLVLALAIAGLARAPAAEAGPVDPSFSPESAGIETQHPADYFRLASQLFSAGKKDEAVFWFYAGQLRFRARLATHPELPRDGEPALFASLFETIGPPINQYAFGDIPGLARVIDRVLAWDAARADPFSVPGPARAGVANGLRAMKADMLARADTIRAQRASRGLENRTR